MIETPNQLEELAATLAVGSAAILGAGLAGAALFRRVAARGHALLTLAAGLAIAVPLLVRAGERAGLGVLPAAGAPPAATATSGDERFGLTPLEIDAPLPAARPADVVEASPMDAKKPSMIGADAVAVWAVVGLLLFWAALSCTMLGRSIVSQVHGRRILNAASPITDSVLTRKLARAAARLNVRSKPVLRRSRSVASPVIWCWGARPILLLPDASSATETVDWESVFCHELAHWKRRDHVSTLLADAVVCIVPWNPIAWIARSHLAQLADRACDEYVLAAGFDGPDYADSLLQFAAGRQSPFALGAVSNRTGLARRIDAILSPRDIRPTAGRGWLIGLTTCAACVCASTILLRPAPAQAVASFDAQETELPSEDIASLAARLQGLSAENWREAYAIGDALAALPGDDGLEMLASYWSALPVPARQQMLKAWNLTTPFPLHQRMHPRLLDVLNLGMTDAAPDVQNWSIGYLRAIAFQDFSTDYPAYQTWYGANRERPLLEVMRDECRRYLTSLAIARGKELDALTKLETGWVFRDVPELAVLARDVGMLDAFARWMRDASLGTDAAMRCMDRMLPYAGADEAYLRDVVLAAARTGPSETIRTAAIRALAKPGNGWAVEPLRQLLLDVYQAEGGASRNLLWAIGQALGEMNDPSVIPTIVAIIEADDTYDTVYGLGYFALGKLTGVPYDESHNGAWWKDWWTRNSMRYPQAVAHAPLPKLAGGAGGGKAARKVDQDAGEDIKDVLSEEITLGKDENRRYFLIGLDKAKKAPKDGYKLLVVMPGGDGSADFLPFVKRIAKNALPEGYLIAQPIAPRWSDDKDRIVWPTRLLPDEKMKFSTEDFVKQVISDVRSRTDVDPKNTFALGWSSGGPPVYTLALLKNSPICGAFVAMSVYKPDYLPDRSAAKGRPFYLLHSPQDFIRLSFPEAAEKDLTKAGAVVELRKYEGGHGWHGDVFGMIREGVDWLEMKAAGGKDDTKSSPSDTP